MSDDPAILQVNLYLRKMFCKLASIVSRLQLWHYCKIVMRYFVNWAPGFSFCVYFVSCYFWFIDGIIIFGTMLCDWH